jgi:hypothetical protein
MHLASGTIPDSGKIQLGLNAELDPYVVLGNAEGECTRLRIKKGNNQITAIGAMPDGLVGDPDEALKAELHDLVVKLKGRINYSSGSPSSLLHIAAGYRPGVATAISAIQLGATTSTTGAAMIDTNGWVRLSGTAPASTSDFDVLLDGEYQIGQ